MHRLGVIILIIVAIIVGCGKDPTSSKNHGAGMVTKEVKIPLPKEVLATLRSSARVKAVSHVWMDLIVTFEDKVQHFQMDINLEQGYAHGSFTVPPGQVKLLAQLWANNAVQYESNEVEVNLVDGQSEIVLTMHRVNNGVTDVSVIWDTGDVGIGDTTYVFSDSTFIRARSDAEWVEYQFTEPGQTRVVVRKVLLRALGGEVDLKGLYLEFIGNGVFSGISVYDDDTGEKLAEATGLDIYTDGSTIGSTMGWSSGAWHLKDGGGMNLRFEVSVSVNAKNDQLSQVVVKELLVGQEEVIQLGLPIKTDYVYVYYGGKG